MGQVGGRQHPPGSRQNQKGPCTAEAHGISLPITKYERQGPNKEFEGKIEKGNKEAKEENEQDRLRILSESSLAQYGTPQGTSSPDFNKSGEVLVKF